MIAAIRVKVCGLTSLVDAAAAEAIGADYLGFILHAASPRHVTLEQFRSMRARLEGRRLVAVCVCPEPGFLNGLLEAGADFVQVHAPEDTPAERLGQWTAEAGRARLWLVPRLPPGHDIAKAWLDCADTFLLDGYDAGKFGGTGRTGDWAGYGRHRSGHPDKTWILSGGLGPANIGGALAATGARFVDINSGVELSAGVKDPAKLKAFAEALRAAAGTPRR